MTLWRGGRCWEKGPRERGTQLHRGGSGWGSEGVASPSSLELLNPSLGPQLPDETPTYPLPLSPALLTPSPTPQNHPRLLSLFPS